MTETKRVVRRIIKQTAAPTPPAPTGPPPADEPYVGLDPKTGRPLRTGMPHVLVAGVTSSGKSRTVISNGILEWDGRPVVSVSSKSDILKLTIATRARYGPVYVLDLSNEVPESDYKGLPVTLVSSDPTTLVDSNDTALELAGLLMEVGDLQAGDGSGGGGDGAFWKSLAMRPLAGILTAAASYFDPNTGETVPGGGITWALAAADDDGTSVPVDPDAPVDYETPNWTTAINRLRASNSRHAGALAAARARSDEQRGSIAINMQTALGAWGSDAVAGNGTLTPFTPEMLTTHPSATLFIVSPLSGSAAPAAATTLTGLVNHWRRRVDKLPALLMSVDELPNTSPLPRLANWIGEARGLGLRIVAAVQATSQFEPRWGAAGLKVLRDVFPLILILPPGSGDPSPVEQELLDRAAWAAGSAERATASTDVAGHTSGGRERSEVMTGADLLPGQGQGRLLIAGGPGKLVNLIDIDSTTLRVDRPA